MIIPGAAEFFYKPVFKQYNPKADEAAGQRSH